MPLHKIPGGYQYGRTGKKYYGKDARKKALKQQLAIELSGYKEEELPKSKRRVKLRFLRHASPKIPLSQLTPATVAIGRQMAINILRKDE